MSYSYAVPAGPASGFRERAIAAVSAPDDQRGAATLAAAIANNVVESRIVGTGWVAANISGHAKTETATALATCNISVQEVEAPVEAPATD